METLPFIEDIKQQLLLFTFVLPRVFALFIILPVFSSQIITGITRVGITLSLSLFIFPIAANNAPDLGQLNGLSMAVIVIKEAIIGFLIGYCIAAIFWAVESVGFVIDNQRGASMASSMDPLTGSQTSPLGVLLMQAITVVFFVGGGFLAMLGALYKSYLLWPVFSFYPEMNMAGVSYFLGVLDQVMTYTVLLAAPVALAMFLAEYGLALVSRFAPQLNVFFLAMPVKSAVSLLLLSVYVGVIIRFFGGELLTIPTLFSSLGGLMQ